MYLTASRCFPLLVAPGMTAEEEAQQEAGALSRCLPGFLS